MGNQHCRRCNANGIVSLEAAIDKRSRSSQGCPNPAIARSYKRQRLSVGARREVILCAGAICTPQILLITGIGPNTQGSQTQDNPETPVVKELPAVGAMSSDHYSFSIMFELSKEETFDLLESICGIFCFGSSLAEVSSLRGRCGVLPISAPAPLILRQCLPKLMKRMAQTTLTHISTRTGRILRS